MAAAQPPLRRLSRRRPVKLEISDWIEAPVRLPSRDGRAQEFAIGDVHGHVVQFWALLDAMAGVAVPGAHLTLLGDLVDRGPASLACLRLAALTPEQLGFGGRTMLLGNHEIAMLMAIGDGADAADARELWVHNGGSSTLAEAGITPSALSLRAAASAVQLREAAGEHAFDMLEAAPLSRERGNLLFVHAGIDPAMRVADFLASPRLWLSDEHHPAWIREPFLLHRGGFEGGRIVVHGHTPEPHVLEMKGGRRRVGHHRLDHDRLGLDGGSYGTGVVAGAEFRDGGYRVFTAAVPFV